VTVIETLAYEGEKSAKTNITMNASTCHPPLASASETEKRRKESSGAAVSFSCLVGRNSAFWRETETQNTQAVKDHDT
jgi:hypothetical protein